MSRVLTLLLGLALVGSSRAAPQEIDLAELSLEQLLEVQVAAPSRIPLALAEAPATVIVLSRRDLESRGYSDLSQILDDLPGMEVVRPRGATYLKNYWRGWRNTIGEPFLLQIDGMELNHLYFRTAEVMATLPLSSISRVEVVYGPASSAYGANAFMGVINVITEEAPQEDGWRMRARMGTGGSREALADVHFGFKRGLVSFRATARIDRGDDLAEIDPRAYEYSRPEYLADPRLWGGLLGEGAPASGKPESRRDHRAFDLRLGIGPVDLGLSYFRMDTGYGLEYASDRAQKDALWSLPHWSGFLTTRLPLGEWGSSTTRLRFRATDVDHRSSWIESLEGSAGDPSQRVQLSYWSVDARSVALFQSFDLELGEHLDLSTGVEIEGKELQKAYDISYGPAWTVDESIANGYPLPPREPVDPIPENEITTTDVGIHVQARYDWREGHTIHLGIRRDDNSDYGGETTFRAGYVLRRQAWTFKLLYGEAFQEPSPRVLYGGWTGSGSDPLLSPERSETTEASVGFTQGRVSALASLFHVENQQTIVNTSSGAANLGDRSVTGVDLHLESRFELTDRSRLRIWGYYSELLEAEERKLDGTGHGIGKGPIGDLADHKLLFGTTLDHGAGWQSTILGRWISARETVASNPLGRLPGYLLADLVLAASDLWGRGLGAELRVENLFDEDYAHPGVREADAGEVPGSFDADGRWRGSRGFFSSALPQPGRTFLFSIRYEK